MWTVFPPLLPRREQETELWRLLEGGDCGAAKTKTTTRKQQQTANQRSNLMRKDFLLQPSSRLDAAKSSPSDRWRVQRPDQGRAGPLAVPSFLFVSCRFLSFLGRSASDPHQMRASVPHSCARQARSRQNRLGDMHRNTSAVHLVPPSNLFESCSDRLARGRAAKAAPCSSSLWQLSSHSDVSKSRASDVV